MTQVVEYLLSKYKALSSNTIQSKKKKRKQWVRAGWVN
jgi:hypothetical protein